MKRYLAYHLAAALMALSLTKCAPPPPSPPPAAAVTGSFMGSPIDPGGAIRVTYSIAYSGSWTDIRSVYLAGLPPNSPANSTLPIPSGSGVQQVANVNVSAPARDGDFPLQIWVDYGGTFAATTGIGTLRVNNIPSMLDNIRLTPNTHKISDCGPILPARFPLSVEYTVTDKNGARDVYNVLIRSITPVADPLIAGSPPMSLSPPTRDNAVQETVSTALDVLCDVRAPQTWTWSLEANDDDTPAGITLTVTGTTVYSTTP